MPTSENLTAVQERLFEMLNSVSLDEPRASETPIEAAAQPVPIEPMEAPADKKPPVRRHPTDCPNCGASEALMSSTWCESCGFHPRLNRCLAIDAPVDNDDENRELTTSDLLSRVPVWAWILGSGIAGIIVLGGIIRGGLPDIQDRSPLALSMIFCGLLSFAICHVRAFYIGLQNSEKFHLGTLIAQPVETWRPACQQLPQTRRLFYGMSWGLTAVFMALVIVGIDWNGLFKPGPAKKSTFNPLASIMKIATTMSSVTAQAQQGGDGSGSTAMGGMMDILGEAALENDEGGAGENVEDALEGFTGKALDGPTSTPESKDRSSSDALSDAASKPSNNKLKGEGDTGADIGLDQRQEDVDEDNSSPSDEESDEAIAQRLASALTDRLSQTGATIGHREPKGSPAKQDDFLIFGYTLSVTGRMHSVVIAELSDAQRGRYIATVPVDQLSPLELERLQQQLDANRMDTPALRAPVRARWVAPMFTCTVSYNSRTSVGTLKNPKLMSYRQLESPAAR